MEIDKKMAHKETQFNLQVKEKANIGAVGGGAFGASVNSSSY